MNIIVTGASRGIGYELARKFASDKDNAVLVISRNEKRLQQLERQCLSDNPECRLILLPFDLENLESIETELRQQISGHFDSLDVLVNNAGLLIKESILKLDPSDAQRMMNVNFIAPLVLVRSLLPLLEQGNSPHVVNIGSMAGVQGAKKFPGLSGYSASKAAVHILTECLAAEFTESRVRFNSLALGAVQTEMLGEAFPGMKAPLKTSEMADFVVDFATNGQKYFNGKTLPVAISTP
ncbi:SDR family NAD(P)-dependent oxidoreductase [Bacteroidota bacterium]